jgi:hypothetical protein
MLENLRTDIALQQEILDMKYYQLHDLLAVVVKNTELVQVEKELLETVVKNLRK